MVIDTIKERRTIRSFKVKPIEERDLYHILDAARWAPSAGNLQNWRFLIVKDANKRRKIANLCAEQTWMADAPVHVAICSITDKVKEMFGKRGKELYAAQSTAAAIENIMVSAWSLGIGTAWVAAFIEDEIRHALQIPFDIEVHAIVALGYPREIPEPPRRLHLSDILFFEKYGNRKDDTELFPISKHLPKAKKTAQDVIQKILERKNNNH